MWRRGSGVRKTLYLAESLYDVIGVNKFLPKKWGLFGTPLTTGLSIFILFY